ncbi:unnamed protein product [Ranitomeya imitator]|uniref:Rootletin-like coiled-coil domain-containing protein n=1 Tax=Ranitomeya imitator TaxID=111125 RepID=A0ABN9L842_9NEOB|nr:unnamed protein product [Ranitomeya imitator]
MTQGVELGRDWLTLQRELQNSLEAQKRQAVLVEKLQAKVVQYRNRYQELQQSQDFSLSRGELELEKALRKLEEEQQRCESLAAVNALLREDLVRTQEANKLLGEDIHKLTADWSGALQELERKENEWKEEREVYKCRIQGENTRLLRLWTEVVTFHRHFTELKTATERDLSLFRGEWIRCIRLLQSSFSSIISWKPQDPGKMTEPPKYLLVTWGGGTESIEMAGQEVGAAMTEERALLDTLGQREESLKSQIEALQLEVETKTSSVQILEGERESLRSRYEAAEREANLLKLQMVATEKGASATRLHLETAQEEASAMRTRLVTAEQESSMLREQLVTAEQESSMLREQLVTAEQEASTMREQLVTAEQESSMLREQLAATEQEASAMRTLLVTSGLEASTLREQLVAAEQEASAMREQLAATEQEASAMREQLAATEQEASAMREQLAATEQEASVMRTLLVTSGQEASIMKSELEVNLQQDITTRQGNVMALLSVTPHQGGNVVMLPLVPAAQEPSVMTSLLETTLPGSLSPPLESTPLMTSLLETTPLETSKMMSLLQTARQGAGSGQEVNLIDISQSQFVTTKQDTSRSRLESEVKSLDSLMVQLEASRQEVRSLEIKVQFSEQDAGTHRGRAGALQEEVCSLRAELQECSEKAELLRSRLTAHDLEEESRLQSMERDLRDAQ